MAEIRPSGPLLTALDTFQDVDQLPPVEEMMSGRAFVAADTQYFAALGIEQIGRRTAVHTVKIARRLAIAENHLDAGMDVTPDHALEARRPAAAEAFLPIDGDDV